MADPATPRSAPFLLLFRNAGEESHAHLTAKERAELSARWNAWYEGLAARGKARQGSPLALGGRVVSGVRGQVVRDGPYAEAKEAVGGYVFLDAVDLDEATELAKDCPGLDIGLTVEVRAVVAASPVLPDVRGRAAD